MLAVAQIDLVHGAEFAESLLRREIGFAQMITKQGEEQVGQVADKDVGAHAFREPVTHGTQLTSQGLRP